MERPALRATSAKDESFVGVTYHVEGELVPALTVELASEARVYFEHHILLWKHPTLEIGIRPMKGALERMMETNVQRLTTGVLSSMSLIMNRLTGPGRLAPQSMYLHVPSGE